MSRTLNKHHKNWNMHKRILKEMTKGKVRAAERKALKDAEQGLIEDVDLLRWKDYDDIWNYD